MDLSLLEAQLRDDGYTGVVLWRNSPGEMYPNHIHAGATVHIVIEGKIFVTINGREREYKEGDRFIIPAGVSHAARMGESGCLYIMGEKV